MTPCRISVLGGWSRTGETEDTVWVRPAAGISAREGDTSSSSSSDSSSDEEQADEKDGTRLSTGGNAQASRAGIADPDPPPPVPA
eukprot:COSAG04_NODE_21480_length_373_cov_0.740876_1_plen_84_part_01